jgi:hypothetical protein
MPSLTSGTTWRKEACRSSEVRSVLAHLLVITNEKRQKLSKRRDKVALEGYLAE